jgi:hypothetical protein
LASALGIAVRAAVLDPQIAADGPSQLLQRLQERCKTGLFLRIILGQGGKHAEEPYSFTLLRACGERPGDRAAEQCN